MGKITGAQLYLTEFIKNPKYQYPMLSLLCIFSSLGTLAALGIAKLCINLVGDIHSLLVV